jgi:RimJ/RimL family protein N-acetyltransferase
MSVGPFSSRIGDAVIGDPASVGLVALHDSDLAEIERLLHESEVAEWWHDLDMDEMRALPSADDYVSRFKIVVAQRTVGYAHAYHANRDEFWVSFGVPRETFGIDLSIGDPGARGRGIGRAATRLLVERVFAWPEVVRVQIDPDVANARAVRAYRGAGFVERGIYPGYDGGEMLYMTIDRSDC